MGKRKQLAFYPEFEGPIEGWVKKYIGKNLWRVADYLDFEDLLQDAREYFFVCRNRYKVENARHFMSIFQRCMCNHFNNLATQRTREQQTLADKKILADEVGCENAYELALLDAAPEHIKQLIDALVKRGAHINRRETTNTYWCRLIGKDPEGVGANLREEVRNYFNSN